MAHQYFLKTRIGEVKMKRGTKMKIYVVSRVNIFAEDKLLECDILITKELFKAIKEYKQFCDFAKEDFETSGVDYQEHNDNDENGEGTYTYEIWEKGRSSQNQIKVAVTQTRV